jgi:hypothetical protein
MTATTHKIHALRHGSQNDVDWEAEYVITFRYSPGSKDYWNRAAGLWEQGWGPEIEYVSISPDAGDHGAFSDLAQRGLEEWAADWLADNADDAIEIAQYDRQAEADRAAEYKREELEERGK